MRTTRSAIGLLLFLALPSLSQAQLSIALLPDSAFPPLGTKLAGLTEKLSTAVFLNCTGYNPTTFTDRVDFGLQFSGASPIKVLPFTLPITLSSSPFSQGLDFDLTYLPGFQAGSITVNQIGYIPGDDPCRDDPTSSFPDPPDLSEAFVYTYNGSSLGIHDYRTSRVVIS